MANTARASRIKQNETEVAILQFQVQDLVEKVDDLKLELQDLKTYLTKCSDTTHTMIHDMQTASEAAHRVLERKVASLEKWRWMIMGAGIALGAVGFEALGNVFAFGL